MPEQRIPLFLACLLFVVPASGADPLDETCRDALADAHCEAVAFVDPVDHPCTSFLSGALCSEVDTLVLNAGHDSDVAVGAIRAWEDWGDVFAFDDHVPVSTDIQGRWSINQLDPDRGWFYGFNTGTEIAHVTGITDVCQIRAAGNLTYQPWSVGPVDEGDHLVLHNTKTGYYGAFRLLDIYGPDHDDAVADVDWYLQTNGTDDFGPC